MRTAVSHFWVGNFKNNSDFANFFGENPDYYTDERKISKKYISAFAKSQNENRYDHDFFECGFNDENTAIEDRFSGYSYAEEWLEELKKRIAQLAPNFQMNSIAFIEKGEIKNPTSVKTENFELIYLGVIEYEI